MHYSHVINDKITLIMMKQCCSDCYDIIVAIIVLISKPISKTFSKDTPTKNIEHHKKNSSKIILCVFINKFLFL